MRKFKEQPLSAPGPRRVADVPCYIYILATIGKSGDCSPVKIGIASDPIKRLASIQTSCPNPIRMQTFFGQMHRDYARHIEREAHNLYKRKKLHGEWFDASPGDAVGLIADLIEVICTRDMADEILRNSDGHPYP
jgi:hypothetical protein